MRHVSLALMARRRKRREANPLKKPPNPHRVDRVRGKARHAHLYNSTAWRTLRAAWLADQPLCVLCGQLAQHVDHIRRHEGDRELFFSRANLQSLCAKCHRAKTAAERRGWRPAA